jgi:hypothetical protein
MSNRPFRASLAPANKSGNNIAQSQTPGGAGNLTLNGSAVSGGVGTYDIARRVAITSAGADTGRTFTVTGTDRYGRALSEAVTGPGAGLTVYSTSDFLTVTQIAVDAATAGAITVGQGDKVSSQWFPLDRRNAENLGFGIVVTGTINYTVEHTYEDPFSAMVGVQPNAGTPSPVLTPFAHSVVAAKTANQDGSYVGIPPTAVRVTINSYSNGATLVGSFSPGSILK